MRPYKSPIKVKSSLKGAGHENTQCPQFHKHHSYSLKEVFWTKLDAGSVMAVCVCIVFEGFHSIGFSNLEEKFKNKPEPTAFVPVTTPVPTACMQHIISHKNCVCVCVCVSVCQFCPRKQFDKKVNDFFKNQYALSSKFSQHQIPNYSELPWNEK